MLSKPLRVSLALERDAEPETVIAAVEEALGRPLEPVWRLRGVPALSVSLTKAELERVRQVPGVRSATEERRYEPPRPILPGRERE